MNSLKIDILSKMVSRWRSREKRSYVGARKIWLAYYRDNREVPPDVLKVFANGIKKYHENYDKKKPHLGGKKTRRDYIIHHYVNAVVYYKKISQAKAFEKYVEKLEKKIEKKYSKYKPLSPKKQKAYEKAYDSILTIDAVKKAYQRMDKLISEDQIGLPDRQYPWLI